MSKNSWNNDYVLNLPNGNRRNNVAGVAGNGPNIVENVNEAPINHGYNINAIRLQVQQEQQRLRNRARANSRKQLLNYHVGHPNDNYKLEDQARAMELTDENIAEIRGEIVRMRNADPNLVARQAANNALAEEIMAQHNNREINQNQVGGKRRRRRSSKKTRKTRKTRKNRKQRKTRARKH